MTSNREGRDDGWVQAEGVATTGRKSGGLGLVNQLRRFIRRYVVMSDEQLLVVALWAIHTYAVEAFEQTPYLAVTSPERQCGKSRLLETLAEVVCKPWAVVLPSEAVVFRTVDRRKPTLMLDEVDAIFNPRTADRYEGLRALLNNGHRRGMPVPRCVGTSQSLVEFDPFCPKVLAGIGTLPDTVADRSVPIRLQRRRKNERVKRFFRRDATQVAEPLRTNAQAWAEQHKDQLAEARPEMPNELSDRMQEGCESLVAIADACGCGKAARAALVGLLAAERLDDQETMRLRLLRDLRTVWQTRERKRGNRLRAIATSRLLSDLCAMDEAPWGSYYGHKMEARDLASLLHHYGIRSTTIRNSGTVAKGYKRDDLYEAWQRYLS